LFFLFVCLSLYFPYSCRHSNLLSFCPIIEPPTNISNSLRAEK
jgi:hypothetical protein